MDDATLDALKVAYSLTPANLALLSVLLSALLARGRGVEAAALLDGREPSSLANDDDRAVAAEVLLLAGDAERSVAFSPDTPRGRVLRAKALLRLGRDAEAARDYDLAVRADKAVQDVQLETLLAARPVERGGQRLRVIANDDTTATEVDRVLAPPQERVAFADVAGLDAVKDQIRKKIILPFQKPSLFERFRKKVGGGILLYGPPGCGKTLLARATAGEVGASFFNVSIADVLDMYIGESERKLRGIFDKARQRTPSVLFFDELEALAGKRQHARESTSSKMVSLFLSELDGFAQNNSGVLVLGATNVPWAIDPAMRRPGRFDRVVFIPPPDRPARLAVLELTIAGRPVVGALDLGRIADRTSGFSGADLANVVETAADAAIERSLARGAETPIEQSDFEDALREVKATTIEWLTTAKNYARYANEAGQYDDVLAFLSKHGR
jgi:ATP-dependent 26S proteasome regulatory subunit